MMTWPEYLDLLLAFLTQTPRVVAILGVVLSMVVIILATSAVAAEDIRRRDIYYEDYIRDNHRR
jgi:hypothetical protein